MRRWLPRNRRELPPASPADGLRLSQPMVRAALFEAWQQALGEGLAPVAAWNAVQADAAVRRRYTRSRGKGGWAFVTRTQALELAAAAIAATNRNERRRVVGFGPNGASSPVRAASGHRLLQLLGGLSLVPEGDVEATLGEAMGEDWILEVAAGPGADPIEPDPLGATSAWQSAAMLALLGPGPLVLPREARELPRARMRGTRVVLVSPLDDLLSLSDEWLPVAPDGEVAFWEAFCHVILREQHAEQQSRFVLDAVASETDAPFLVFLEQATTGWRPGGFVRAADLGGAASPDGFVCWNPASGPVPADHGRAGDPLLSLIDVSETALQVEAGRDADGYLLLRGVPVRFLRAAEGDRPVTTLYDLLFARLGVARALPGDWPTGMDDARHPCTPAWQAAHTGVPAESLLAFAREWMRTAEATAGRCALVLADTTNADARACRAALDALLLSGCRRGGFHILGKHTPPRAWTDVAFALDWARPPKIERRLDWERRQPWRAPDAPRVALLWGGTSLAIAREPFLRWALGTSDLGLPDDEPPRAAALDLVAAVSRFADDAALHADLVLPAGDDGDDWELFAALADAIDRADADGASDLGSRYRACGSLGSLRALASDKLLECSRDVEALLDNEKLAPCDRSEPRPRRARLSFATERTRSSACEGLRVLLRGPQNDEGARMLPLFGEARIARLNPVDARELGIDEGDLVELANSQGTVCARAALAPSLPRGVCVLDTVADLAVDQPRSPARGGQRSGTAASLVDLDTSIRAVVRRLERREY
ncbi:MAG: molybdopterin dinucleotide binding domain-containing protein [Myxococcales bacterium]|jgi:hypothetical protein